MQVSQVNDHISHAVIGGGPAIEFGISSSAEFFNILSSTLYKDQILAVTREVLCNANDAHIEAGCTDTPVEITLTEDKFVIKDFGKGIHRDDIGPIYGTYGNSTKKNDGTQTGGFGLGCKAPFAYTDHFEVISCHDGIKTIYNMSKSSGQVSGKPGITPIMSAPTNETGLQVTIKIKNSTDYYRYVKLVNRIVRNGDMNMKLNGVELERLGFDSTKTNYMVTAQADILDTTSRIMLRYGNVIYPIDSANAIQGNYSTIVAHLDKLTSGQYSGRMIYSIVFQAPPHSIAVTPSRESLSMQDHTVNTLNKLFTGYIQLLSVKFPAICTDYAEKAVENAVKESNLSELLNTQERLPGSNNIEQTAFMQMFDMTSIANRFMQMHYPSGLEFRKEDIARRVLALSHAKLIPRGQCTTFLKALEYVHTKHTMYGRQSWGKTDWLQRRIIKPIISKAVAAGLDVNRLYLYDTTLRGSQPEWSNKIPMMLATKAEPSHLFHTLPYLRNIVVVSTSLKDIWNRARKHPIFKDRGVFQGFMFYHSSMKNKEKEAALEFFKQRGMAVVDLTFRQEWEPEVFVPANGVPKVKKIPKKGVVQLSSVLLGSKIDLRFAMEDSAARTESPEFILNVSYGDKQKRDEFPEWDKETSKIIIALWGDKGAITNNDVVAKKWTDKGVMMFKEYVNPKVMDYVSNSPTIKEYWAFKPDRLHDRLEYSHRDLLDAVYTSTAACTLLGIKNNLTDEDKIYLTLWEYMLNNHNRYRRPPEIQKIVDDLDAIPLDPHNDVVIAKFVNNPLIKIIDANSLSHLLSCQDSASPTAVKAIEILVAVLNQ